MCLCHLGQIKSGVIPLSPVSHHVDSLISDRVLGAFLVLSCIPVLSECVSLPM